MLRPETGGGLIGGRASDDEADVFGRARSRLHHQKAARVSSMLNVFAKNSPAR